MIMKKGNPWALLPIFVFLLLFVGVGVATGDFYKMPVLVAFLIATMIAFMMNRKESFQAKVEAFCKGAGDSTIIQMVMIFLLAGAFSGIAKEIGSVESTVNFSLSILPSQLIVPGLFIIACFISFSMGTSVGTIAALAPIGIGIAESTGLSPAFILGAVVGGGMFGDNLSMISDTTIAAVRTQGCGLKDKFKENFFIVLPAAVVTVIILAVISMGQTVTMSENYGFNMLKVLPYVAIIIGALLGTNVFILLSGSTVLASVIGLMTSSVDLTSITNAISQGMLGMAEISLLSILVGGVLSLIKYNGGMDFLLHVISRKVNSKKGAEFGIAGLAAVVDSCTANNTIAIVMAGPIAKEISEEYNVTPSRTASILDIFSTAIQGIIPYGAQLLTAAGLAAMSPIEIIPYLHYPILMGICGLVAIGIGFPNRRQQQEVNKKAA
ncbi:MAG: Na+/H+ antiporter NhaC family protein [Bacillaceae bacterium]